MYLSQNNHIMFKKDLAKLPKTEEKQIDKDLEKEKLNLKKCFSAQLFAHDNAFLPSCVLETDKVINFHSMEKNKC